MKENITSAQVVSHARTSLSWTNSFIFFLGRKLRDGAFTKDQDLVNA